MKIFSGFAGKFIKIKYIEIRNGIVQHRATSPPMTKHPMRFSSSSFFSLLNDEKPR